jgi:hypothetical protein
VSGHACLRGARERERDSRRTSPCTMHTAWPRRGMKPASRSSWKKKGKQNAFMGLRTWSTTILAEGLTAAIHVPFVFVPTSNNPPAGSRYVLLAATIHHIHEQNRNTSIGGDPHSTQTRTCTILSHHVPVTGRLAFLRAGLVMTTYLAS